MRNLSECHLVGSFDRTTNVHGRRGRSLELIDAHASATFRQLGLEMVTG